jgi:hypothetical protein
MSGKIVQKKKFTEHVQERDFVELRKDVAGGAFYARIKTLYEATKDYFNSIGAFVTSED